MNRQNERVEDLTAHAKKQATKIETQNEKIKGLEARAEETKKFKTEIEKLEKESDSLKNAQNKELEYFNTRAEAKAQESVRKNKKIKSLETRAKKDAQEFDTRVALLAEKFKSTDTILQYVAKKIDLLQEDEEGRTPFHIAAMNGQTEIFKILIETNFTLDQEFKDRVDSLTEQFANTGHKIVKFLEKNFDLDQANESGQTSFYVAAKEGHIEILEFLEDQGANLNQPDLLGWTPIIAAIQEGHTEIVKFLAKHKDVDLDHADKTGCTAIHAAANNGLTEVVEFLATQDIDLDQADMYGHTPVYAAAVNGHTKIVKILLESGVSLDENLLSITEPKVIEQMISKAKEQIEEEEEEEENIYIFNEEEEEEEEAQKI